MIEKLIHAIQGRGLSVVLPEGEDSRILAAARRMADQGIASPILLGAASAVDAAARQAGVSLEGIRLIDPAESDRLEPYAEAYAAARGLKLAVARRLVARPLYFGGMMVAKDHAHAMVAGVAQPTALVIQAGVLTVGLAEEIETASSFFLMIIPDFQATANRAFIFADCAVNVAPTPRELADIAIASHASARRLLPEEPRVAMLSFSTKGSASHAAIDRVREALAIVRAKAPHLAIDGEFQADAAIVPAVAARKVADPSPVAGRANVLVFPDLNAGNIAYKLTQYLAGARAIGPFLQGFRKPLSDLSRGASVEDIVATAAVCLAQV